jgi:membrane-bound metal-dependent hydrolase YbcI (DUF457 family)
MISINILLAFLLSHWIADFVFQTTWMATNKSKNIWALLAHVVTYTVILGFLTLPFYFPNLLFWVLLNGLLHGITDFITSRISAYFWQKKDVHYFFVTIGLDQVIHYLCLFKSYLLLV